MESSKYSRIIILRNKLIKRKSEETEKTMELQILQPLPYNPPKKLLSFQIEILVYCQTEELATSLVL